MGDGFAGVPLPDERNEFLEQTRLARQTRAINQKREQSILVIQKFIRKVFAKQKARNRSIEKFSQVMANFSPEDDKLVKSKEVYYSANLVLKFCNSEMPTDCLEKLCRYIVWSRTQTNVAYSYIGCGFNKEAILWIQQLKHVVICCLKSITILKPELVLDSKQLSLFLTTLVNLTSFDKWTILQSSQYSGLIPGMKRLSSTLFSHMKVNDRLYDSMRSVLESSLTRPGKFFLTRANLLAIATLLNRSIKDNDSIDEAAFASFVLKILTVPAYVYHVQSLCSEGIDHSYFLLISEFLCTNTAKLEEDLSKELSLLANFVELGLFNPDLKEKFYSTTAESITCLLSNCAKHMEAANKKHYHPILGWVDIPLPAHVLNSMSIVKKQIEYLWGPTYLEAIFLPLGTCISERFPAEEAVRNAVYTSPPNSIITTKRKGIFGMPFAKAIQKALLGDREGYPPAPQMKLSSPKVFDVASCCELFVNVISTFSICRLDILTSLCFKQSSKWLMCLWKMMLMLGRDTKEWASLMLQPKKMVQESVIVLFSDAMIHFITMLDDHELYEDQGALGVFKLADIAKIAQFINLICYRVISSANNSKIRDNSWSTLKTLLVVLKRRDCRRKFVPDDYWLIDSSKMNQLVSDIERGKKTAKRVLLEMPHVVKEEDRVMLFRKWASSEKTLNSSVAEHELLIGPIRGLSMPGAHSSTLITIQRGRIVEDGYSQLASLSPKALKGTIRVRFQNKYGLDEAGIDQDGVFKEFLEETIAAVFNPSLNLFKTTDENLLYPSPSSYLHENHLQLFEFVGKMLAKAIYEGIVVDVHFANFFLHQILGYQQSALFSAIDELQSLDKDLYASLNYIKHYEGDVQDLELTFSVDQDCLGTIKTTELIPGGRTISVTNENKISYLYSMAHFHLYVQIKDQTAAFLKGFRTIIPNEWIRIFAPSELQRLISGEDTNIDLADLRRNTQYYGGFHDNHRVVIWLWEILEHDFQEKERKQFLKFVTSCSKPPLLGFSHLDPPFSIRCVEVSDDEDTGDTIGSVLRGFLTIAKKEPIGRLPTSSTCFNLLKLPNYQKKGTLREKLRYAITSNVGFELS